MVIELELVQPFLNFVRILAKLFVITSIRGCGLARSPVFWRTVINNFKLVLARLRALFGLALCVRGFYTKEFIFCGLGSLLGLQLLGVGCFG